MDEQTFICPVCGQQAFDEPPGPDQERTCRHCGTLLVVSDRIPPEDGGSVRLIPAEQGNQAPKERAGLLQPSEVNQTRDWWSRSELILRVSWRALLANPTIVWPILGSFLAGLTGLYVTEAIEHPAGSVALLLGPGLAVWLSGMTACALAMALFRQGTVSFARALRMLLEHKQSLSRRIIFWIALGALALFAVVLLVSLVTAMALFLPGGDLLLGILLGLEVLAATAIAPIVLFTGAALSIQPLKACRPGRGSWREDLNWWRRPTPARSYLATGMVLAVLAGLAGLLVGLAALDTVLSLNILVVPTRMHQVLSASVLAPLLGIERAIEPELGIQVAGAAASVGLSLVLSILLAPAMAIWATASATAAMTQNDGPK